MTFAEFIALKGAKNLAVVCEVAEPTAYSWRNRDFIPRNRWDVIMSAYELTYADMRAMEILSRAARAAKKLAPSEISI